MNIRDVVVMNEKILKDLVTYDITKGNTAIPSVDDTKLYFSKMAEFKRLIKSGEMSYQELENDILSKYGITEPLIPTADSYKDDLKKIITGYKQSYNK